MPFIHFDEARAAAGGPIKEFLQSSAEARALLIADLFGKLRLALWSPAPPDTTGIEQALSTACGPWWTGEILDVGRADRVTQDIYEGAWQQAQSDPASDRFRSLDRHRSRTAWFADVDSPLWEAPVGGPPLVVFYSFKGGLGRSTLLASFAIQRSRAGDRVCVLDFDLDSPGIGSLLSADAKGLTARWGVVDFLLERAQPDLPLADYYHRCDRVAGAGEIVVFPAGHLDEQYTGKLARVDLEEAPALPGGGLQVLLDHIRQTLKPQWVLVDARTGLSEPAGQLLSGVAHLHVLLGTIQDQSWQGLNRVIDRLGKFRVVANRPQAEILLAQAMVPVGPSGPQVRDTFSARAEEEFTARYYAEAAEDGAGDDRVWDMRDLESLDAPHVSVPLDYEQKLAGFRDIAEVADDLCTRQYAAFAERVVNRFHAGATE